MRMENSATTIVIFSGAVGLLLAVIAYRALYSKKPRPLPPVSNNNENKCEIKQLIIPDEKKEEIKQQEVKEVEKEIKQEVKEEVKKEDKKEEIIEEVSPKEVKLKLASGVYETRGRRSTMEDKHFDDDDIAASFPEQFSNFAKPSAFYGVYDGHRGIKASEFLEEHLHLNIINNENFIKGNIETALKEAFIQTDNDLLLNARNPDTKFVDGSTAAVAFIIGNKLYAANCGDAEVVLGRKNEQNVVEGIPLSKLHKPTDPEERKRIVSEGGMVLAGRVGGTLAVARAFGDVDFKTPYEDDDIKLGYLLTAEPFITTTELIPHRDQFIIVGCDGVWEKLSRPDSVSFVASKLESEPDVSVLTEELVNHALNTGSQDNISAIIIKLNWE